MQRIIVALLAGAIIAAAVFAAAASLNVDAGMVGSGGGAVESCDADGVSIDYTVAFDADDERFEITHVTVIGIAGVCDGASVQVALMGDGDLLASADGVADDGTSGPLPLDTAAVNGDVDEAHVAISN